MYSIGDPTAPFATDPRFDSIEEAEIAAIERTCEPLTDVLAVWDDDDGEVVALVFAGIVYRP